MKQEYEKEIDILDMVFYIVCRWRSIIIGAFVVMALFVGYIMLSNINDHQDNEEEIEAYEKELEEYNLSVKNYDTERQIFEGELNRIQRYVDSSILMKIDPLSVYYSSADIYIQVSPEVVQDRAITYFQQDIAMPVVQSYKMFVLNGVDLSDIANKYGVSDVFLRELICANAEENSDTLNIKIVSDNAKLSDEILDSILKQIQDKSESVSADIMKHSAVICNKTAGVENNSDIMDKIYDVNMRINVLKNSIYSFQMSKSSLTEPEKPAEIISKKTTIKSIIKYIFIGFILGLFLIIAFYAVIYIFSGCISTNSEIKDVFGYYMLGAFALEYKRNGAIDKLIRRLAKAETRSDEILYQRVVANIRSLSEKGQKLLLMGTVTDELLKEVGDELKKLLPDYNVLVSGNFVEDASVMAKLSQADGVILLERCGISTVSMVEKEVETIQAVGKTVIGYIMK